MKSKWVLEYLFQLLMIRERLKFIKQLLWKIRNKYQVKYDNGDPTEVLNLDKEKYKILK